jgi:hypothetical protein
MSFADGRTCVASSDPRRRSEWVPTQADDLPEPQSEGLKPVRSQWRNPTAETDSLDLDRPSWVWRWRDGAFARYASARRGLPLLAFRFAVQQRDEAVRILNTQLDARSLEGQDDFAGIIIS